MHGKGEIEYANGTIYKGEIDHGKKHGVGTYTYSNMDKYVGSCFRSPAANCSGNCLYRYEGEWVSNNPEGKGTYTAQKGWTYEGQFQGGKRHGEGKMM